MTFNSVIRIPVVQIGLVVALAAITARFIPLEKLLVFGWGGTQFYIVQSGSMEPSIMTGDLIVVKPTATYQKSDVITFFESSGRVVTHRIVEKLNDSQPQQFATKGDANSNLDANLLESNDILGKVILVMPKVGYLANFSRSLWGIIILVVVPSTLLVIYLVTEKR